MVFISSPDRVKEHSILYAYQHQTTSSNHEISCCNDVRPIEDVPSNI